MKTILVLVVLAITTACAHGQELHVGAVSPAVNALNVPTFAIIAVNFDDEVDEASLGATSFVVSSQLAGIVEGSLSYNAPARTATFAPLSTFHVGDLITVVLTPAIQSVDGHPLAGGAVWSFTTQAVGGPMTFQRAQGLPVPGRPFGLVAADFDGDLDIDLATANWNAGSMTVLRNDGTGVFAVDTTYEGGGNSIVVADVDEDGDVDLLSAGAYTSEVSILRNNGDGSFAPRETFVPAVGYHHLAVGDFDADGHRDLAVANISTESVTIHLGDGEGGFTLLGECPAGLDPRSLVAADLDNDGDQDLATTNLDVDSVSVLLNDGHGAFARQPSEGVEDGPYGLCAADLNGDGDLDLAVAAALATNSISVLLNEGQGTFADVVGYNAALDPVFVSAADLDGDGDLDLVGDYLAILRNNGDGTFAFPLLHQVAGAFQIAIADFDGDGDLDIAGSRADADSVAIVLHEPPPQAIFLRAFTATRLGEQALVSWELAAAADDCQFWIWRQENGAQRERISGALPPHPSAQEFIDPHAPASETSYWLQEIGTDGTTQWHGPATLPATATPMLLRLDPVHPNPFHPQTTLTFQLPHAGRVKLEIFDSRGQLITTLMDEPHPAGPGWAQWDGRIAGGESAASGIYFARIETAAGVRTQKVVLMR